MKASRLLALLLSPSLFSFILSALFAALALLGASWPYLRTQPFFATYLSGEYGFGSFLGELNAALADVFNSDLTYNIAVICFAVLFGLGVYAVVMSFRHIVDEAQTTLDEVEFADQRARRAVGRSLSLRAGIRIFSSLAWLGYTLFFFNGILPFCASLVASNAKEAVVLVILRNVLAFTILLVATHLHVVFVRLILLRPRILGARGNVVGRGGH